MGEKVDWYEIFVPETTEVAADDAVAEGATQWNDFEKTWKVWLTVLVITGVFEIVIFSAKTEK
ncbi:MAG: hypothetical protein ABIH78_02065 [Candidatus Peregrinibacteria bacterium]